MDEPETAEVAAALRKVLNHGHSLEWVNSDIAAVIDEATVSAASTQMLTFINEGVDPVHAGAAVAQMMLVLAFNLGLVTGREMQASTDFAAMMGGAFGAAAPDAGNPE